MVIGEVFAGILIVPVGMFFVDDAVGVALPLFPSLVSV